MPDILEQMIIDVVYDSHPEQLEQIKNSITETTNELNQLIENTVSNASNLNQRLEYTNEMAQRSSNPIANIGDIFFEAFTEPLAPGDWRDPSYRRKQEKMLIPEGSMEIGEIIGDRTVSGLGRSWTPDESEDKVQYAYTMPNEYAIDYLPDFLDPDFYTSSLSPDFQEIENTKSQKSKVRKYIRANEETFGDYLYPMPRGETISQGSLSDYLPETLGGLSDDEHAQLLGYENAENMPSLDEIVLTHKDYAIRQRYPKGEAIPLLNKETNQIRNKDLKRNEDFDLLYEVKQQNLITDYHDAMRQGQDTSQLMETSLDPFHKKEESSLIDHLPDFFDPNFYTTDLSPAFQNIEETIPEDMKFSHSYTKNTETLGDYMYTFDKAKKYMSESLSDNLPDFSDNQIKNNEITDESSIFDKIKDLFETITTKLSDLFTINTEAAELQTTIEYEQNNDETILSDYELDMPAEYVSPEQKQETKEILRDAGLSGKQLESTVQDITYNTEMYRAERTSDELQGENIQDTLEYFRDDRMKELESDKSILSDLELDMPAEYISPEQKQETKEILREAGLSGEQLESTVQDITYNTEMYRAERTSDELQGESIQDTLEYFRDDRMKELENDKSILSDLELDMPAEYISPEQKQETKEILREAGLSGEQLESTVQDITYNTEMYRAERTSDELQGESIQDTLEYFRNNRLEQIEQKESVISDLEPVRQSEFQLESYDESKFTPINTMIDQQPIQDNRTYEFNIPITVETSDSDPHGIGQNIGFVLKDEIRNALRSADSQIAR